MPNTHCLPSGSLGASEVPVINFPAANPQILVPVSGLKRGVVIFQTGLETTPTYPPPTTAPITLATNLQSDGWVWIQCSNNGDNATNGQYAAIWADIQTDSGTRYKLNNGHFWDHAVRYVQLNYGNWPIVVMGQSLGALMTLIEVTTKTSTITAYATAITAQFLWTANPVLATFFGSASASTTVAAGSNGATLPYTNGTLNVVSTSGFASSGTVIVVRGAGGWQILTYTGTSGGNQFTTVNGGNTTNGALATGDVVQQSVATANTDIGWTSLNALGNGFQGTVPPGLLGWHTDDIEVGFANTQATYNAANGAGAPIQSYSGTGNHVLTAGDQTSIYNWVVATVDPLCPKQF